MKRMIVVFMCFLSVVMAREKGYRDSDSPVEKRIENLLSQMTLMEKIRQLDMYSPADFSGPGDWIENVSAVLGSDGIGSIHDFYPETAEEANRFQKMVLESCRLKIPALFIEEGLHGYGGKGSTTFPVPLGLASTWNQEILKKTGRVIATEARARNVHMILGPVLGIARDPRWGRVEETYGEDPYLTSRLGLSIIEGMRGEGLKNNNSVMAEPKHFGVHSYPQGGVNTAPVNVGIREARSSFLYPFEVAVKKGKVRCLMAAYHEWDGVPCVTNQLLLDEILRKEWGFKGFVLSDLGAISMQVNNHKTAASPEEALAKSISSGTDMQFYDFPHKKFEQSILKALEMNLLKEEELDQAVKNVLRLKFEMGLFENPYADEKRDGSTSGNESCEKWAYEAGRESIVLLKNEDEILPLNENIEKIAVIGQLADISALGGYSPKGAKGTTFLEGLKEVAGDQVEIVYEPFNITANHLSVVPPQYLKTPDKQNRGLWAEFFNNEDCSGKPVVSRIETNMSLYWHNNSPAEKVNQDNFSVRWSGWIEAPYSGTYSLGVITDDRGRLYFDGNLIVDNWDDYQKNVMMTNDVYMEKGTLYPIKMEYGEIEQFAGIRFKWKLKELDSLDSRNPWKLAKETAEKSQVAIIVFGENSEVVGEGKDKSILDLNENTLSLFKTVKETGTPVIAVMLNGRPLNISWVDEHVPAIIEAWYPGQAGGKAIADVIFGKYNPSGKLPVSFPKSVGRLPVYYNHKPSARKGYVDGDSGPLYPFGFGLSYTEFELSELSLSKRSMGPKDSLEIKVQIKNTGKREGAEVVQLYINDLISGVTTPVKELKGFEKVFLSPGETRTVVFKIGPEDLSLWNHDMEFVVEPGDFELMVGNSSQNVSLKDTLTVQ